MSLIRSHSGLNQIAYKCSKLNQAAPWNVASWLYWSLTQTGRHLSRFWLRQAHSFHTRYSRATTAITHNPNSGGTPSEMLTETESDGLEKTEIPYLIKNSTKTAYEMLTENFYSIWKLCPVEFRGSKTLKKKRKDQSTLHSIRNGVVIFSKKLNKMYKWCQTG